MTRSSKPRRAERVPWQQRLHRFFLPVLGPAHVGNVNDSPPAPAGETPGICPDCQQPWGRHEYDRSGGRARMYCPAPDTDAPPEP